MEFKDFPLKQEILEALHGRGLTTPTPIQAAALPLALEGKDLIGQARTGTGKTLAFALPIAQRLSPSREKGRKPRALVLTPTRELALQVSGELQAVAPHLKVVAVYGGTGYAKQKEELLRGADVVVATPGRALDYLKQGVLDLSQVEIAVLDEADEMLSMGFEEEVEALLSATPPSRQTLLFSATLPSWARRLAERYMRSPVVINVVREEGVTYQEEAILAPSDRLGLLSDLLYVKAPKRAIVFTRTKAETEEVATGLLRLGHAARAIHGDLSQSDREKVMRAFREGEVRVLVATDVAARGLDIPEVDLVVHHRLPDKPETYQHRSGRTGRAGRGGEVVILYGPREKRELAELEKAVGRTFKRVNPPTPRRSSRPSGTTSWPAWPGFRRRTTSSTWTSPGGSSPREGWRWWRPSWPSSWAGPPRRRASSPGRRAGAPTGPRGRGSPCPGSWPFSRSGASRWARSPRPRGAFTWTSAPRPSRRSRASTWSPPRGWRALWKALPAPVAVAGSRRGGQGRLLLARYAQVYHEDLRA
ncbi:DEAD/DEAH box helicase [Thermus thermophilus]|nr:DEAD/DEAH box helicase [Thermus thermophilus]